ncbi:phospholipid scramblase family protein C343.06c isoform X3 [Physcomitrium patens]|uniref:phospholipid scramblase family protein C343.06c isoform X3 n=1 Tax=Physcomitrium patens TaxID=3218 RepID=UPI000D15602C|nr:altered inheritance rate of mitochondria protein 25-like isoform X2 [Physcomitrium patens]XP_024377056.1 altered inheritance rate of mitochondria protein 25-like isoform X2 [Physcomitrium patens]|eukprot:XP_024377055.1 altered inheritance rate of mitochondria protein 25-like isoform X2 [Physcomitrella patens]
MVCGDWDGVLQTLHCGIYLGSVKHTDLEFATGATDSPVFNEGARNRQYQGCASELHHNGSWKYFAVNPQQLGRWRTLPFSSLHTLADCESARPCWNRSGRCKSPWSLSRSLALGGVRHESVYEKRMREIRSVRARGRRMKQSSEAYDTDTSAAYDEDPSQPPLSQPLRGSLKPSSPEEMVLVPVLARPDLIITRNVEWANLAFGFEQENSYIIMDPRQPQAPVGYINELSNVFLRQILRTRRPFTATIYDGQSNVIFKVRRPTWVVNSSIFVEIDGNVIGECHRRWHLWRRIYDVYLGDQQFATVENPGFWNWTFSLKDKHGRTLAEIDRNWRGFGYEFLTDAGQYVIRFGDIHPDQSPHYIAPDEVLHGRGPLLTNTKQHSGVQEMHQLQTAAEEAEPLQVSRVLTLSERAVALALAISLDNDYFSRHSNPRGGFLPFYGSDV